MMKRRTIALLLLLALTLTGCASKNTAYSAPAAEAPAAAAPQMYATEAAVTEEAYDTADMAYPMAEPAAGASRDNGSGLSGTELTEMDYGGRKIIRSISLSLRTDDFDAHLAQLLRDAQTAGGYVQSSYVYGTKPEVVGDGGRNASYTLRIPVEQVDAFVTAASKYGTLVSQNEDTQDVTDNYFDTETRLAVYRTTLERLQSILVKTNNLEDVIALEQEITDVTIQIEELTSKLKKYDGMIAYATVNVELNEMGIPYGPAVKTAFGERVVTGFRKTLSGLGNFLEDLAVFLLAGSPVLIPLALIAWLVFYLGRRRREKIEAAGGHVVTGKERRAARRAERLRKKQAKNAPQEADKPTEEDKNA